jgi:hypothetical protein
MFSSFWTQTAAISAFSFQVLVGHTTLSKIAHHPPVPHSPQIPGNNGRIGSVSEWNCRPEDVRELVEW